MTTYCRCGATLILCDGHAICSRYFLTLKKKIRETLENNGLVEEEQEEEAYG